MSLPPPSIQHSILAEEYKKMDPIICILANKHHRIKMECPRGRSTGTGYKCRTTSCKTYEYAQLHKDRIQYIYMIAPWCGHHKCESRFWDWQYIEHKAVLGPGDEIFNFPKMIRAIPWQCASMRNARTMMKTRYKFSPLAMMGMLSTQILNSLVFSLHPISPISCVSYMEFFVFVI